MRRYETIFILRPNAGEEEINRVIDNTTQIILNENGTIVQVDRWGIRKLAYLIKKESLGYYVFCDYAGTPAAVAEIERKFRIDDIVMKYMTIKTKATFSEEEIKEAIAEATARASAAALSEEAEDEADESADADQDDQTEEEEA
jgi:small subunit ribosomal protein S6